MDDGYLSSYGEINNNAHQKPADLIGAPAFIWHQAFWNPAPPSRDARQVRADKILAYIRALHARISSQGVKPTPPVADIVILPDDRARSITLQFIWQGIRSLIRIEHHTEYVTITSVIDASVDVSKTLGGTEKDLETFDLYRLVKSHINQFVSGAYREYTPDNADDPSPVFKNVEQIHKFIYRDIWDLWFFPKILDAESYLSLIDSEGKLKIGANKFADIRGFITCDSYPASKLERRKEERCKEGEVLPVTSQYDKIQIPFDNPDDESRDRWHRTGNPGEHWARWRLFNVWPFLKLAGDEAPSPLTGRTEFTVSRLLNGRVLYASALGPQPRAGVGGPARPLVLYLHSTTQCERQIGRIVDRLCQMGTLRLATLIPMTAYKRVPEILSAVEEEIAKVRNKIHSLIQAAKKSTGGSLNHLEIEILNDLDHIQQTMGNLMSGDKINETHEIGGATLEYRLLRTTYYKNLFLSLFPALRIERLEGYQPYDEFIKRRLQSSFGFIDAIEQRFNAVRKEWRSVDQLYLTATVTILTGALNAGQNDLAKLEQGARDTQVEIKDIQLFGEAALFILIIPYYTSNVVSGLFNCESDNWCEKSILLEHPEISLSHFFSILSFVVFAVLGVWRFISTRKKIKTHRAGP